MARISRMSVGSESGDRNLIPRSLIVVEVVSFTFQFDSAVRLRECIDYYGSKLHPSSRVPQKELAADLGEHWREQRGWEVERWFDRLPMYLMEEPTRQKVPRALREALTLEEAGKL